MVIDWFTVIAQALNFLVLVGLLKHFLYKPILDAIDARELRIATELADAAAKQTSADEEQQTFRLKNEEFDAQHDALLSQANAEAAEERKRLVGEARHAADTLRDERQEVMKSEFQAIQQDVSRRSRDEVFAITRKVLAELAGTTLEDRMTELFVDRLRGLDLQPTTLQPMHIQSAFALNSEQQSVIETALKDVFDTEVQVQFDTVPAVIAGIELVLDGHKVAWSVSEYLVELEKNISEILGEQKPGFRAGKTT